MKKYKIYAVIAKKDDFEYKKGDIVEVSLWRKNLLMRYNPKYQVVKKILTDFYI